ncbi:MAG: aminopeptidase P family protein [Pseudomonadota bacterium]
MTEIAQRLALVRDQMRQAKLDALIVPRADEYLGEYIPAHNERLRWISGFTGSAGLVLLTQDEAAIFVDGRYKVQVRLEVSEQLFRVFALGQDSHVDWLAQRLSSGAPVACDSRMHSLSWYRDTDRALVAKSLRLVTTPTNIIDICWDDRPKPVVGRAILLSERFTGESSESKRKRIGAQIAKLGADAALIFAPDSISWLLNVRGTDLPKLPVVLSLAMLNADGTMTWLVHPERVPPNLDAHVGAGVTLAPESEVIAVLEQYAGKTVLADADTANAWCQLTLEEVGADLLAGTDPALLPKACKNAVEVQGSREAHIRDAIAEVQFLAWLDAEVAAGRLHTEDELAQQLLGYRSRREHFQDVSFDSISAAGGNAAMCHYNHLNVEAVTRLPMNSVYLIDSGGQYLDGTTDITRTIAIGDPDEEISHLFTLVLKGHIALDTARFPAGTTGSQLDSLARQFLWQEGFDYDHGTGHGVGVFLSVHEGPQRIAKAPNTVALARGMIVSNEPGYYRDHAFGIRCENLLVVRESERVDEECSMLEFEALTLVPFDARLIKVALLTEFELNWVNDYHQRVADSIGPLLPDSDRDWLVAATRPLAR